MIFRASLSGSDDFVLFDSLDGNSVYSLMFYAIFQVKSQSMISEDHVTFEDWSNDAENTALITEINYSLTDIQIETSYFK